MVDKIDIIVEVDTSELEAAEEKAEEIIETQEETIEEVEKKAHMSFNKVMLMARGAYMITAGIIRATGGTVSTMFRMAISAAISTAAFMYPLLTAESLTPGMQVQAAIGLINLAIAMEAIGMAARQQQELARGMMAINTTLHGMSMMLGSYYG